MRALNAVFFTAVAVSIVHYADNWQNFEKYPTGGPGPEPTANSIWIAWVVLTAFGVAGYLFYRQGRIQLGAGLLAVYSISGLVGIGHYSVPGMSELAWWRHAHIVADILCGVAVLVFAVKAARDDKGRTSPIRVTT